MSRDVDVVVVGAGPVGAALAAELGFRDISVLVLEATTGEVVDARLHAVSIRTMELARRWGIDDELRNCGWPLDHGQDVVWGTNLGEPELARIAWPAIRDMTPPEVSPTFAQRCPQRWFNPILTTLASRQKSVEVRMLWRMDHFRQDADGVSVWATDVERGLREEVRCRYLVGCDGARSEVRRALEIERTASAVWGTSAEAIVRSPALAEIPIVGDIGRYTVVHEGGMSISLLPLDGRDEFRVTLMVHDGEASKDDIADAMTTLVGREIDFEFVTDVLPWTNRAAEAQRFVDGRVILAGDSAHTMPTTGGFGMNTGILDAVDLAWKLDALLAGWGGGALLPSYEFERRSAARRTAALAGEIYRDWVAMKSRLADVAELAHEGERQVSARRRLQALLISTFTREFNAVGGALGYRYEDSPICIPDGSPSTPDTIDVYVPTARPGHLAPHVWLSDGSSTLDLFGRDFVLLVLGEHADDPDVVALTEAARKRGIPWRTVRLTDSRVAQMYERDIVLVRPDGHVAWRSNSVDVEIDYLLDVVSGAAAARQDITSST